MEYAGVSGAPDSVGNYNTNKWGPRAGIAWQLDSKTVVRGGYGLFWAPQIYLGGPLATLGYANNTQYTGKSSTDVLTNPFPNGLLQPVGNTLGAAAGIGSNFTLVDPQTKSPRVQQYSIDVQRELGFGVAMEVGYVGSHSTHLTLGQPTINIDALNPSYLSQGSAALDAQVPNPFAGVPAVAGGTLSGPTVSAFQLLLPFPAYTGIYQIFGDNNHASYNSMVIKAQKRFSHGLTFLSTFTWSKNMDESSGGVGTSLNAGAQGYPQNPYNTAAEYSLSNVDTPLRWTTSISYQLPIGKGKDLWNIDNRALDLIVGGWVVNTVIRIRDGLSFADLPDQSELGLWLRRATARYDGHGAGHQRQRGTAHLRLHQSRRLLSGAPGHLRQHAPHHRLAGSWREELGYVDFQELSPLRKG